jgi:hypothetical protein
MLASSSSRWVAHSSLTPPRLQAMARGRQARRRLHHEHPHIRHIRHHKHAKVQRSDDGEQGKVVVEERPYEGTLYLVDPQTDAV